MPTTLVPADEHALARVGLSSLPSIITNAGPDAARRFVEFFVAQIRNRNTRAAYGHAVRRFFAWCRKRHLELSTISPVAIAAYIESHPGSPPTVKQHLAAISMLFDFLVTGQILPMNPASSVKGPRYSIRRGKTPVLTSSQARQLLDSIDTNSISGLRDKALLGVMVYSFARVSAVTHLLVEDYHQNGKRWWVRLHEKGGKEHAVPCHHNAEAYLDAYISAAGIGALGRSPLFRTLDVRRQLSVRPLHRNDVLRMVKRRAKAAGLPVSTCCHTFRATGITAYLENGGTIEKAQQIANHESPRTTKLYDRTDDTLTLDEIERIGI